MQVIHIMADGSVRNSVKGITIPNKDFYIVFNEILKRQKEVKRND